MNLRRSSTLLGVTVIALALAGCAKTASPTASRSSTPPAASTMTIKTASVSSVGTVLVDSDGRTLYTLSADKNGTPTCVSSPCTSSWPPELVPAGTTVHAGTGVDASLLGTVKTPSGSMQVTYNHMPLYRFSGDSGPGTANGQDIHSFGGVWHPEDAAGKPVMSTSSSTTGTTTGSSGTTTGSTSTSGSTTGY